LGVLRGKVTIRAVARERSPISCDNGDRRFGAWGERKGGFFDQERENFQERRSPKADMRPVRGSEATLHGPWPGVTKGRQNPLAGEHKGGEK